MVLTNASWTASLSSVVSLWWDGQGQFCSRIKESQAKIPAIPVSPVAVPAFAASSREIGGKLMIGPPGGGVYIGAGAAGGSGMSIGGNCGGGLGKGGAS